MTYLSSCPIMLIYGGRSVSSEHRNRFYTALIGNGRGFLLHETVPHPVRLYCAITIAQGEGIY